MTGNISLSQAASPTASTVGSFNYILAPTQEDPSFGDAACAQFFGPRAVDGNVGDLGTTFGNVISAAPPRILQGTLKFSF
jgi:hypothetical protein